MRAGADGRPAAQGPLRGLEADVLIECSGAAVALEGGLRGLRGGARAVVVGMSSESHPPVPLSLVQRKEIELTGTFRYANTYPAAIALASSGAVQLDELVTGHYGLAQVAAALQAGRRDPLAGQSRSCYPGQLGPTGPPGWNAGRADGVDIGRPRPCRTCRPRTSTARAVVPEGSSSSK